RSIFVFLPNVQPVTALIIICGIILGSGAAFLLALLISFLSNILLGMGIWTVWQVISWGVIGIMSGIIGKLFTNVPMYVIIIYSIICGYFYGFIISLTTYQVTGKFWPYYMMGLPYDTYHAIWNAIFISLLYPTITYLIKKYANNRFDIQ